MQRRHNALQGSLRPLAELHVHLNGTLTIDRLLRLAEAASRPVPETIAQDGRFVWTDFAGFIDTMTFVASFLRTPEDYRALARDYLTQVAGDGGIYVEISVAPTAPWRNAGLDLATLFDAVAQGIDDARQETGIEARIIALPLRHDGPIEVERIAHEVARLGHPACTGFGLAGNEIGYPPDLFGRAFAVAAEAGLGCTIHAGEAQGADSIKAALQLPVTRIGHGVRCLEDPSVVAELRDRGLVLEVCPSSNVKLGFYPDAASHPLPQLLRSGLRCTINSDDPTIFQSTLAEEYDLARTAMGLDDADLQLATITALESAFVDADTRARLLATATRD